MDPPLLETQSPWVLIDFLTPQTQKIMQEHLLFTGFKTLPNERFLNSPNPAPRLIAKHGHYRKGHLKK